MHFLVSYDVLGGARTRRRIRLDSYPQRASKLVEETRYKQRKS